jgi:Ca2+-transporting ATPase
LALQRSSFGGELISEFAFTNELKMMGHIWRRNGSIVIAAKGSPERILTICELTENDKEVAEHKITEMSKQGLRVIAVATASPRSESEIPAQIIDCRLTLCGPSGLQIPT